MHLEILSECSLPSKSACPLTRLPFCGYIIDTQRLHNYAAKIRVTRQWSLCEKVHEVRHFIHFRARYQHFVDSFKSVVSKFNPLVKGYFG